MATSGFFAEPTSRSGVKAALVAKYFWAWARLLHREARQRGLPLQYLDLYAGVGRYDDGSPSTPLLVLENSIADPDYRDLVAARLNDIDLKKCSLLEEAIRSLPGVESLRYRPRIENGAVDDAMTEQLEAASASLPPTLSFVDPWGYKGLSLRLIRALSRPWGCDCIFFFNYNRVNAGLSNPLVVEQMDALFGKERADNLRGRIAKLSPEGRERAILDEIKNALEEGSARRVLPFAFKADSGNRTSHYLILVTKRPVGFEIMKNIMAKESSDAPQGVPTYEFNPIRARSLAIPSQQLAMFDEPPSLQPLDVLQERLLHHFADRSLTMVEVYQEYNRADPRYLARNYKDALLRLEARERIVVQPPANQRPAPKGVLTFADWVRVTFPPRGD